MNCQFSLIQKHGLSIFQIYLSLLIYVFDPLFLFKNCWGWGAKQIALCIVQFAAIACLHFLHVRLNIFKFYLKNSNSATYCLASLFIKVYQTTKSDGNW